MASPEGKGISFIMNLANITRLHNAITAIAGMRRILALVSDYSQKRKVFNKKLIDQPLHIITVSNMKFLFEGNLLLLLKLAKMQGKSEKDFKYKNSDLLRTLLPLLKLYSAKCGIEIIGEGMECFGGNGYMENSQIPQILRDAYVLAIWEGTTNVLSLDYYKMILSDMKIFRKIFFKIRKRFDNYRKMFVYCNNNNNKDHKGNFELINLEKFEKILKFFEEEKKEKDENLLFGGVKTARAFSYL